MAKNKVITNGPHVYFIRLGNASQEEVKNRAFNLDGKSPDKVVLIGYDKEVSTESLNNCIRACLYENEKNPEAQIHQDIFETGLFPPPEGKTADIPPRAKNALRQFSLARPGVDYFFTFYDGKLWYGTPKEEPHLLESKEIKEKSGVEFRSRKLEWHDYYGDVEKDKIKSNEISGIISRVNMFQETVYKLTETSPYSNGIDAVFSEHAVFFDVINKNFPRIIENCLNVVLNGLQVVDDDIKSKVEVITSHYSQDVSKLIKMLCNYLHPSAFEKFVDVAYSSQGYTRCSELGGTMKDIDMEYLKLNNANNYEHFAVQVKSEITDNELNKTLKNISADLPGLKCQIVTHSSHEDSLADVVKDFTASKQFEFVELDNLIAKSDKKNLLAFLVLNIAGRKTFDWLIGNQVVNGKKGLGDKFWSL